jgi:hypothetical protein
LRREPRNSIEIMPSAPEGESTDDLDEVDEDEQHQPKRIGKVKQVEHTREIGHAIDLAFGDLQELASESRGVVDNAFPETERIQTLENSAYELENLEKPEVPAALSKLLVKFTLSKRRYSSRNARASDAVIILEACALALQGIPDGDDRHADSQAVIGDLWGAIDTIQCCEFPGAYQ